MLRFIRDNPLQALEFLKKHKDRFSTSKQEEIRTRIVEKLDSYGREFLTRQTFEGEYADFDVPSDSNGYTVLDIDKLEAVISYLAEAMSNLYKVKLMKSLWYSDALAYQRMGKAMTGLVYRHATMGALPVGHYSLMNLENLNVKEEISPGYDSMLHVYPSEHADYTILSSDEKTILDTVIRKLRDFKAAEIVNYMHEEKAYRETSNGEIIPFSLAKEIRGLDS